MSAKGLGKIQTIVEKPSTVGMSVTKGMPTSSRIPATACTSAKAETLQRKTPATVGMPATA